MSTYAKLIQIKYKARKITAREVWALADGGELKESEAILICGPRPKE